VNELEKLVAHAAAPDDPQVRVNRYLLGLGEAGVRLALETIESATSLNTVAFAAFFLAGLPGHAAEKNRAIEAVIERHPDWLEAIADLVEFAREATAKRLLALVLARPDASGVESVAYELAQHFPDFARPHRAQLERFDVYDLLLPGAPDDWVAELVERYRRDGDPQTAVRLSFVRTDAAREALVTLLAAAPAARRELLAALLESSGVFADTREASTYEDSYRGFLAAPEAGPHPVGGAPPGPVPYSPFDGRPAERILELRRKALALDVGGTQDPIYFWYEGDPPAETLFVQRTPAGLEGLMTPVKEAVPARELVPNPGSAVLEKERHPYGLGGSAVPGSARIQVGGYPHWIEPERFPRCPLCRRGMLFLASVDSGLTSYGSFEFLGTLFGFWCENCDVACARRQG
jgi:hypothetical protein